MNFKAVLRAYSLLRQLTDDESALLATLRGMSDNERELLVESLQPEKMAAKKRLGEVVTRKIEKCEACNYTRRAVVHKDVNADGYHEFLSSKSSSARSEKKSARAVEMAATLGKNLAQQREAMTKDIAGEGFHPSLVPCAYVPEDDTSVPCDLTADSAIHDKKAGYPDYHEFVAPSAQTAGVGD